MTPKKLKPISSRSLPSFASKFTIFYSRIIPAIMMLVLMTWALLMTKTHSIPPLGSTASTTDEAERRNKQLDTPTAKQFQI